MVSLIPVILILILIYLITPKPVLVTYKANTESESRVRGYMCKFRMKANQDLMKLAYECGVGMKGSQGWGMVKAVG